MTLRFMGRGNEPHWNSLVRKWPEYFYRSSQPHRVKSVKKMPMEIWKKCPFFFKYPQEFSKIKENVQDFTAVTFLNTFWGLVCKRLPAVRISWNFDKKKFFLGSGSTSWFMHQQNHNLALFTKLLHAKLTIWYIKKYSFFGHNKSCTAQQAIMSWFSPFFAAAELFTIITSSWNPDHVKLSFSRWASTLKIWCSGFFHKNNIILSTLKQWFSIIPSQRPKVH